MTEAKLRLALYLVSIQDPHHHTCRASSRQIVEARRCRALKRRESDQHPNTRNLIATRDSTATTASAYRLNFTQAGNAIDLVSALLQQIHGIAARFHSSEEYPF